MKNFLLSACAAIALAADGRDIPKKSPLSIPCRLMTSNLKDTILTITTPKDGIPHVTVRAVFNDKITDVLAPEVRTEDPENHDDIDLEYRFEDLQMHPVDPLWLRRIFAENSGEYISFTIPSMGNVSVNITAAGEEGGQMWADASCSDR